MTRKLLSPWTARISNLSEFPTGSQRRKTGCESWDSVLQPWTVSHDEVMDYATNEYRKYKQRQIRDVEQDYFKRT